jgi:hypothetical protein
VGREGAARLTSFKKKSENATLEAVNQKRKTEVNDQEIITTSFVSTRATKLTVQQEVKLWTEHKSTCAKIGKMPTCTQSPVLFQSMPSFSA